MSDSDLDQILKASKEELRAILRALCDDEDVRKKAIKHYHALLEFTPSTNSKRKADSAVHVCVQCDEPFIEEDNYIGDCFYHPGNLEPDYDSPVWADHDERCHGTIRSDWCRKEYPDGYAWDCCDGIGPGALGCKEGKHEADPKKSKKGKEDYDDDDEEDYDSEDYE